MNTYRVGIFPEQMPRDPIQVNTFLEHVLLGQVLETLVSADQLGQIIPGIASSWKVEDDGKKIIFKIDTSLKFSNGKNIDAKDVEYSLNRHIRSDSQSKGYLNSIESISSPSKDTFIIKLKDPRIAIFKVLSRDQLGIVPTGWTFDAKKEELYIGTGPYRLVRTDNSFKLLQNPYAKKQSPVTTWQLVKNDSADPVDYLPFVTQKELDDYTSKIKINLNNYIIKEQLSFLQSSAWFYPHGKFFSDKTMKKTIMSLMAEYIHKKNQKNNFKRSTGVIPEEVSGFNNKMPDVNLSFENNSLKVLKKSGLKVAIFPSIYDEYFDADLISSFKEKYDINFHFIKVEMHKPNEIISQQPDVFVARWAGGFNDPEGFLAILDQILSYPFEKYLMELNEIYKSGKKEQDSEKRNEIFKDLSVALVKEQFMVPGWKTSTFLLLNKKLKIEDMSLRYTPRFSDVSLNNNLRFEFNFKF